MGGRAAYLWLGQLLLRFSKKPSGNFKEQGLLFTGPGGSHSEAMGRGKEEGREGESHTQRRRERGERERQRESEGERKREGERKGKRGSGPWEVCFF